MNLPAYPVLTGAEATMATRKLTQDFVNEAPAESVTARQPAPRSIRYRGEISQPDPSVSRQARRLLSRRVFPGNSARRVSVLALRKGQPADCRCRPDALEAGRAVQIWRPTAAQTFFQGPWGSYSQPELRVRDPALCRVAYPNARHVTIGKRSEFLGAGLWSRVRARAPSRARQIAFPNRSQEPAGDEGRS